MPYIPSLKSLAEAALYKKRGIDFEKKRSLADRAHEAHQKAKDEKVLQDEKNAGTKKRKHAQRSQNKMLLRKQFYIQKPMLKTDAETETSPPSPQKIQKWINAGAIHKPGQPVPNNPSYKKWRKARTKRKLEEKHHTKKHVIKKQ